MLKICAIGDTHNQLNQIDLPEADVLVHAGDLTMGGRLQELVKLNNHLGAIKKKYRHVLIVPGNHDLLFQERESFARSFITNATVLIDEEIVIDGIKFFFSPWQTWFLNWAYNFPENDRETCEVAAAKYAQIPDDVNVLVSHGPPYMMLDKVDHYNPKNIRGLHVGCPALAKRVDQIKPLLHVFGHIHASYGKVVTNDTTFINACICNEEYKPVNKPWVIEIELKRD
jgi:Icc-related predicted phosphoesterase